MLNFPRTVIAPNAPPHKPEVAGGPLSVGAPVLAARDNRAVVHIPPVRDVIPDWAEPGGRDRLLGNHATGCKVQDGSTCVMWGDQCEITTALAERLKCVQQAIIPLVLTHAFRLAHVC